MIRSVIRLRRRIRSGYHTGEPQKKTVRKSADWALGILEDLAADSIRVNELANLKPKHRTVELELASLRDRSQTEVPIRSYFL